jgi:hypothetical protein
MTSKEYRKLVFMMWVIITGALVAISGPRAWTGESWDTDDFMRLVQVQDLLAGQGWSDLTQHRLNPPQGTPMHWTRLPDIPLALVALALSPWLDSREALTVAAMVLPPLYLAMFLVPYAIAARLMLGPARSPVALLVAMTGSAALALYLPGRVDHHGLQLVAMTIATTLLLLGIARRRWRTLIVWAGLPFALSIWIGVETLPAIAGWFAALGLVWCKDGGDYAGRGALAAWSATGVGAVILALTMPRASWLLYTCDAFSLMPLGALALIGAGFGGMHLTGRWAHGAIARIASGAICAGIVAAAFTAMFPNCVGGGYAALDPLVEAHWLTYVGEAHSIQWLWAHATFVALGKLWTPALGLAYCLWRAIRSRGRAQLLWGSLAVIVIGDVSLMFWQVRAANLAHAAALIPLSALITALWHRIAPVGSSFRRLTLLLPVVLVCSIAFWPIVGGGFRLAAGLLPGVPEPAQFVTTSCGSRGEIGPLVASEPSLILNYIDVGPMLLFSTRSPVLGAPYHRNNAGLRTTIELFRATDDATIRMQLNELGVGWIVTCPGLEERTVYRTESRAGLAERLAAGEVPGYLELIPDSAHPKLRLYRIRSKL